VDARTYFSGRAFTALESLGLFRTPGERQLNYLTTCHGTVTPGIATVAGFLAHTLENVCAEN